MKLTTRSRFGLRFMLELGLNYGKGPVYLREVAKREGISEKYLSQLALFLKSAGFISSVRGVYGGYILTKKPSEISLLKIVEILEGDLSLVPCIKDFSYCQRLSICATREIWLKMRDVIRDTLNSFTLEDLILLYKEKVTKNVNYQI